MEIQYNIQKNADELLLDFLPIIIKQKKLYKIKQDFSNEWAIRFFTATTDMRDFIGNVTEIKNGKCSAKGIYRGTERNIKNIAIMDSKIQKVGDRVIVSEHINVNGRLGFLATKSRILQNNINFLNFGWSNEKESRYLRIDIYTGDSFYYKGSPCFAFIDR